MRHIYSDKCQHEWINQTRKPLNYKKSFALVHSILNSPEEIDQQVQDMLFKLDLIEGLPWLHILKQRQEQKRFGFPTTPTMRCG